MINEDALMARVIHIDSRLRKSGRAEEMVYELNEPIHGDRLLVHCNYAALQLDQRLYFEQHPTFH